MGVPKTHPIAERRGTLAKGLTEEDALAQARCAFILRHGHYEDGRITHWKPEGFTEDVL